MKTKVQKLQERAKAKSERLEEILQMDDADMTDDIRSEMESLTTELRTLKTEIESARAAEIALAAFAEEDDDSRGGFRTDPEDQGGEERSGVQVGEQREEKKEWNSLGEFLQAVAAVPMAGRVDPRLMNGLTREQRSASGASEGVLSDGGFLVAPEFSQELLHDALETGILGNRCRGLRMSRNSLTVPGVDETSRANGSRMGGVQAYWENEADSITATKPKFRQINLKAKKLTGLVYMTDELLEDAPAIEDWVGVGFSDEFGFKIDDALIRGTGAGEPLGILNAGCLVSQAKETGQAAATIYAQNVMKMFKRMLARSLRNAVWYINQECWEQIFSLHLEIGTAGVPLFIEPGKLKDAPYGAIFGRPVEPIEQCEALGTVGDIVFADFSQYVLARKDGMQKASSMHVKFTTAEQAFRFILRLDGEPIRSSALTPYKGSDTQSSFIVLATRS